jgi:hypothetical protein
MKGWLRLALLAMLPTAACGCQHLSAAVDPPTLTPLLQPTACFPNPDYVPMPQDKYGHVFETALQVLFDYGFEIAESNRYSGHIETVPRNAPGIGLFFKCGSPDLYDRLLYSLQTYRYRVSVVIMPADPAPADHSGYTVEFIVRKELEDLDRPIRSTIGGAVFRAEATVERQTEVIDAAVFDSKWIYRGRDCAVEQELIRRFKKAL